MKIQKTNKHLGKKLGVLLREMQIKTVLRFYFIPVRMAVIHKKWQSLKKTNKNACEEIHKRESLYTAGGYVNLSSHCGSHCGAFTKTKTNIL